MSEVRLLLKEYESERLSDRRAVSRKPLVRPCKIVARHRRNDVYLGFSRDISDKGIGIIGQFEWPDRSVARVSVHMIKFSTVTFDAELRWTEPFGDGWFITGWVFLDR